MRNISNYLFGFIVLFKAQQWRQMTVTSNMFCFKTELTVISVYGRRLLQVITAVRLKYMFCIKHVV